MNKELFSKAKEAKSAGELLALAGENGIEITEEQAKEYYERINASGELSDDELAGAAGGGCLSEPTCPKCGSDWLTKGTIQGDKVFYCHSCWYTWTIKN